MDPATVAQIAQTGLDLFVVFLSCAQLIVDRYLDRLAFKVYSICEPSVTANRA